VSLLGHIALGDDHTALSDVPFYTETVKAKLVD